MKPLQRWSFWALVAWLCSAGSVAQAVNLYLRSGTTTCLYDGSTDLTLQTKSGTNQVGAAFSAKTNTFYFYSAPLTNSAFVASSSKAGGTIGVQNNGTADFQFQASEVICDYNPATGSETQIVATAPSAWVTVRKNGRTSHATLPQRQAGGAGYTVPAGHLLKVAVTVTVNINTGINGALIYNASGGNGKSLVLFPAKNTLTWPLGSFPSTPDTTIIAPASVTENSTGNIASVRDAGVSALYSWTITNGTITAGQFTRQITWSAGSTGSVSLGVYVVNGCFNASSATVIPVNSKINQTISFNPISDQTYGNAPLTLNASASSGLPVTFTVASGPATVLGNTLTIMGAGTVVVDATQAGNGDYNPAIAEQSFIVNPALLTVSGITASGKVYDQTTDAVIDTSGATLNGVLNGDSPALDTTFAAGDFNDASVGSSKEVSVSGLDISGAGADNYVLIESTTVAEITPATVTGGITANNKIYDGTTAATVASRTLDGVIGSDAVTLTSGTATFDDPNVGNDKTVTATGLALTGPDAGNYALASTLATAKADIFPRQAPAIMSIAASANGPAYLTFAGFAGQIYVIEATASLSQPSWTAISTNVIKADGTGEINDPDAAKYPARFYRTAISCY